MREDSNRFSSSRVLGGTRACVFVCAWVCVCGRLELRACAQTQTRSPRQELMFGFVPAADAEAVLQYDTLAVRSSVVCASGCGHASRPVSACGCARRGKMHYDALAL